MNTHTHIYYVYMYFQQIRTLLYTQTHNHTHSIPNCRIIETGWDKGNWTVLLEKISDTRLTPGLSQIGPECATPTLHIRK